jgi:hypothetical protein
VHYLDTFVLYLLGLRKSQANLDSATINVITALFFQAFLVGCACVGFLFRFALGKVGRARVRHRIEEGNQITYSTRDLLTLTGSEFNIEPRHFRSRWRTNDDFYLEFPVASRVMMHDLIPEFEIRSEVQSGLYHELRSEAIKVVPDLDELIDDARVRAADIMIKRAQQSTRIFNGFVFQAFDIVPSVVGVVEEAPSITWTLYRTDFFTLLTLLEVFRSIRQRQQVRDLLSDAVMPRSLRLLYTGIGLNVTVVAIDETDGLLRLILRKRSARAVSTAATGQWHVTANEALSMTEVIENSVLFDTWVNRALKEEVGIRSVDQILIFSCFLFLEDMQPGVNVLAFCSFAHERLQSMISASKDGEMEYGATKAVPFDDDSVAEILKGVPGIDESGQRVPLSAVAENMMRGISARGVENILDRVGITLRT